MAGSAGAVAAASGGPGAAPGAVPGGVAESGLLGYLLDTLTEPRVAPELTVHPVPPAGAAGAAEDAVPWWAERRPSTSDGQRPAREAPAVDVRAVADLVYAALLRRQEIERDRGGW